MPNHWRAWLPGAAAYVAFDDPIVLQNWLSQQTASSYVMVTEYDLIERQTVPFGVTGGRNLPQAPANPPATTQDTITHIKRQGN